MKTVTSRPPNQEEALPDVSVEACQQCLSMTTRDIRIVRMDQTRDTGSKYLFCIFGVECAVGGGFFHRHRKGVEWKHTFTCSVLSCVLL